MKAKSLEVIRVLAAPLSLAVLYFVVYLLWKLFHLPSDDRLIPLIKSYFEHYGLLIVFVGAVIEGFLLAGQYFPGGFIIFLGVITAGSVFRASEVVAVVCASFFIAYTLNYWVGKYGWYKLLVKFGLGKVLEESKEKVRNKGILNTVFLTYWEPNLASITATAAGILDVPLGKFAWASAAGLVLWNVFWGILVYLLGDKALDLFGIKWVVAVILVWCAVLFIKNYWEKKKKAQ